jgi:glyoxylase-like metal-dependent hydrolase (beta-lactamase superfamily II)
VAPGIWWLGGCLPVHYQGVPLHNGQWAYLVEGERACLLVETGMPPQLDCVAAQLRALLADRPPLRYIWATHQEAPHAGGVGRHLAAFPDAVLCGDVRDYHLTFPQFEDRMEPLAVGEPLDLGGTELTIVPAVIKDLPTTQWAFDSKRAALFTGDGFAFSHLHVEGQCRMLVEEAPELPVEDLTGVFAELALGWMTVVDLDPYLAELEATFAALRPEIVLPTHGLPIGDVGATVPRVIDGFRRARLRGRGGGVEI